MKEYISRASLMGKLTSGETQSRFREYSPEAYSEFLQMVNGAPDADVAPVVRCRECIHMWAVSASPGECYCRIHGEVVPKDGFCYRGERNEASRG